ncbi:MAG TPA: tRNA lysidine(34) synthetase TilS, partial [Desulfatiglandales bacterium]|nr:tRNA lysidine(34) synthetase TilS [Desulfatiglandales bacterium]
NFFEKVLSDYNAEKAALGHNMNDQAETFLINLLRGSGPSGLSGIPPVRENRFIRPLINTTRGEIHAYLKEKAAPFMFDSSNLDKRHLRNKIRLELMPILLEYQPRIIEHLSELAFIIRQEDQFMGEEATHRLKPLILDSSAHALDVSLPDLKKLSTSIQSRIIRHIIKKIKGNLRRIHTVHIKAIMDLGNNSRPQAKLNLPDNFIVKRVYNRLRFFLGVEIETKDFSYEIKNTGIFHVPEINQAIRLEEISKEDFLSSSPSLFEAFLDLDRLQWPLRIRNFRPGDRFIPFGSKGFKKVKDIFIGNKIPSEKRKKITFLENGNDIVWVCGIGIDSRYMVKDITKRILRCKVE